MDYNIIFLALLSLIFIALVILIIMMKNGFMILLKNDSRLLSLFKFNIETKGLTINTESRYLIDIAKEVWKFSKYSDKNSKILQNTITRLNSHLEKLDLTIEDYTGKIINPDLNLEIQATVNNPELEKNYVTETLSPSIFLKDKLISKGIIVINNK